MVSFLRSSVHHLIRGAAIFLVASFALFLALEAMPEDPVSLRVKNPDPARIAEIRAELGLDGPFLVRYVNYLGDFVTGDWGRSLITSREVAAEFRRAFPATLELGGMGLLLGTTLGLGIALGAAALGWRWLDRVAHALGALGLTVPIFWIGFVLVAVFALGLGWLPVSGRFDFIAVAPEGTGFYLLDTLRVGDGPGFLLALQHLALPVLTLSLYPAALTAGLVRARLDDPRMQQMILALRAKGLSARAIWGGHVLRVVAPGLVTVIGTNAGALIGGAALTETVFAWPGMGTWLVASVLGRDFFAIQHGLLTVVLLALVLVTLADVLARALQPPTQRGGDA